MSGGFAFVLDEDGLFSQRCNEGMVSLEPLADASDIAMVKELIEDHQRLTGSRKARRLLARWEHTISRFIKVFPDEYRRVLRERAQLERPAELPANAQQQAAGK
jgi:glutamate synthase domain-containing protein 3